MKEIDGMIKVMQAFADGEKIEEYYGDWYDTLTPSWNWADFNYRIKPDDTWECAECGKEQTSDFYCIPEYSAVHCCSSLCCALQDHKYLTKICSQQEQKTGRSGL